MIEEAFWQNQQFYAPSRKLVRKISRKLHGDADWDHEGPLITAKDEIHDISRVVQVEEHEFITSSGNLNMKPVTLSSRFAPEDRSPSEIEREKEAPRIESLRADIKEGLYISFGSIIHSITEQKKGVDLKYIIGGYLVNQWDLEEPKLIIEMAEEFEKWLFEEFDGEFQAVWGKIVYSGNSQIDFETLEEPTSTPLGTKGEIFSVPLD